MGPLEFLAEADQDGANADDGKRRRAAATRYGKYTALVSDAEKIMLDAKAKVHAVVEAIHAAEMQQQEQVAGLSPTEVGAHVLENKLKLNADAHLSKPSPQSRNSIDDLKMLLHS